MRLKISLALTVLVLFLATGCANTYNRVETGGTARTETRLDDNLAVLVTTPKDGGYAGKIYKGSGSASASLIDASFSRSARLVDVYPTEYHSFNDLKDVLAKNDYGYVVVPTIVVWGRPEKSIGMSKTSNQVRVKIVVFDATTGEEISSNLLEAKGPSPSSPYTFFSSGNLGPDELLSKLTDDYVDDLYGVIFSF